jgi:hypothetical protein
MLLLQGLHRMLLLHRHLLLFLLLLLLLPPNLLPIASQVLPLDPRRL